MQNRLARRPNLVCGYSTTIGDSKFLGELTYHLIFYLNIADNLLHANLNIFKKYL
jgi:hypothetical protein